MTGTPKAPSDERPRTTGLRWQVQMLGGLQLRLGDVELPRLADHAVRLLFAHLALRPRTSHARDALALALWPEQPGDTDNDSDKARRDRLRRVLTKLQVPFKAVPIPQVAPFIADRDTVRLNAEAFDVDVWHFELHVMRSQWDAARTVYRGELMPAVTDPWLDAERVRLAAARARCDGVAPAGADEGEDEIDDAAPVSGTALAPAPAPLVPYRTRFFGRQAEAEQLRRAVVAHRLVTLTGPGGAGKTRLAAETLTGLHGFERVAAVMLADCQAPDQIVDLLRVALGLGAAARPAIDQVCEHLDGQRALLWLDNVEQLAGPAADAVFELLLARLPLAHLLLTSRRALARADERVVELPLLPVPPADAGLAAAAANPGVALFVDRARAARADFTLNARNRAGVLAVCRLLEGLPLALELAAARIRSHAPHEMAVALAQGLKLLARPQLRAGMVGRHASLEAMLGWSWSLLQPPERELLCALAVFRGGFTAEQVQALSEVEGAAGAGALQALVRDSLVHSLQPQPPAGPGRLGMLHVVREFASARSSPPQQRQWRRRHRQIFLALGERLDAANAWPGEDDMPNLCEALASACADGDTTTAVALARALATPWRARGAPQQVLELLPPLAQAPQLPAPHRVALLTMLSTLLLQGARSADAHAQVVQALQLAGDDPLLRAEACLAQADVHWRAGRGAEAATRALALVRQAEALLDGLAAADPGAQRQRGRMLLLKGAITLSHLEDVDAAARLFEQADRLFSALGDRRAAVLALPGRTACLLAQQRWREVIAVAGKGEQAAAELGDVTTQLQLFDRLSNAYDGLQQYDKAAQACQKQARLARRHGMHYFAAYAAWNLCHPLAQLQRHHDAARLMAFSSRYWVDHFGPLQADDKAYMRQVRQLLSGHLGPQRLRGEWERGLALTLHQALDLAAGPAPGRSGPSLQP